MPGQYDEGCASLHSAVSRGHKDVVDLLLARGASVETRDFYTRTPLHYAAGRWSKGSSGIVADQVFREFKCYRLLR